MGCSRNRGRHVPLAYRRRRRRRRRRTVEGDEPGSLVSGPDAKEETNGSYDRYEKQLVSKVKTLVMTDENDGS